MTSVASKASDLVAHGISNSGQILFVDEASNADAIAHNVQLIARYVNDVYIRRLIWVWESEEEEKPF